MKKFFFFKKKSNDTFNKITLLIIPNLRGSNMIEFM